MNIFFSNQIEELFQELKKALFFQEGVIPFAKKIIIVPSPAIKSWLMVEMAKDPDLKLAFGFKILYLDQAIESLIAKRKLPSHLELSLMIEVELNKIFENQDVIHCLEDREDLLKYLKLKSELECKINPLKSLKTKRRLFTLSKKLATLFLQYGIYGKKMVSLWEAKAVPQNLQEALWKRIFLEEKWPYLGEELLKPISLIKKEDEVELHLFSLSFLSKAHFDFFSKVSHHIPLNYYFLSPCQEFWSDIQSDKEHYQMKSYLQKKGVKENKLKENILLDEYFRDQNPLLANFGRLGREMAKLIELSDAMTYSSYVVSSSVQDFIQYEDYPLDEVKLEPSSFSLLKAIQADITLLRDPSLSEKIILRKEDKSIEVHAATSAMREVEILYDLLLGKIIREKELLKLELSDIIVMAPNISEYEPYIKKVFGAEESLLDYHLLDLNRSSKNLLIEEFINFLNLTAVRFDKNILMKLFFGSHFQKAHHFTLAELERIKKWWLTTNFKWGLDLSDRSKTLEKEHCPFNLLEEAEEDENQAGTLTFCLERLFASLLLDPFEEEVLNNTFHRLPVSNLQSSDALLLGKVASLIDSLRADLKFILNHEGMPLSHWATYFECLANAYFGVDETSEFLSDTELCLLNHFDLLRNAEDKIGINSFTFESIKLHLESSLKEEGISFQESHLNSIRFCSMVPMRAVPSKVIVLLGMNEGAFPRIETLNSLDLRAHYDVDYAPTKIDFDRYLFLEAILSARDYLIITMSTSSSGAEKKEEMGSIVVKELISYLDNSYLLEDKKFSDCLFIQHPFDAFDKAYFQYESPIKSYSLFNYELALKNQQNKKTAKHRLISDFKIKNPLVEENLPELILDIKELRSFARNPLKTYFNKKLGIYLRENSEEFHSDEDFLLNHLQLSQIKKLAFKESVDDAFNLFKKKGSLPRGVFKKHSEEKISDDIATLKANLKAHGIEIDSFMRLDFFEGFTEFQQVEKDHFQLPPLKLKLRNGRDVKIVGSFHEILKEGILFHNKKDAVDVIKIWPEYLVYSCLMENYPIAKNCSIFAKCGKTALPWFEKAEPLLEEYLNYYCLSEKNASPLIPEWVYEFTYSEEKAIVDKIDKGLKDEHFPLYNDYLKWLLNGEDDSTHFYCSSFHEEWKTHSKNLYLDLYEKWL